MQRYVDGDSGAFDELFRRYEARAYAYFVRRTHSDERARDLYQELFLRIHRGRDSYDPARAFSPWLFQIARRLLIDDLRRAHRSHEQSYGDREPLRIGPGVGDGVADRELLAQLLDTLSADERYVLISAKVEGIGYSELAEQLGRSVESVKQMASRAMRRLRTVSPSAAMGTMSAGR